MEMLTEPAGRAAVPEPFLFEKETWIGWILLLAGTLADPARR